MAGVWESGRARERESGRAGERVVFPSTFPSTHPSILLYPVQKGGVEGGTTK
ncbi:MAG: hypothetical protein M3Y56_13005 [Armatimonadota bacterium]|nr:hypothetical protein [Armatimonadota bacterium]